MKDQLSALEPKNVFRHFEAICQIPHGSGNTTAIADYCQHIAEKAGCDVLRDALNNLIITIPASQGCENAPAVILQGHLDMVCTKISESTHDFLRDPLALQVEGDWLFAKDTTLGGDDGIAVAMILALSEDKEIKHGKLYGILTVDEETGMLGANDLDCQPVADAEYLINIDSECEKEIVAGCAGGMLFSSRFPLRYTKAKGLPVKLTLSGLDSGHSGEMIQRYGYNAILLMGEILSNLDHDLNISILAIHGGNADNVIPGMAEAEILIGPNQKEILLESLSEMEKVFKRNGGTRDQNLSIQAEFNEVREAMVLGKDSEKILLLLLNVTPNGVQSMGKMIEGQVDTSLNLGIIHTEDKTLALYYLLRSNQLTGIDTLKNRLIRLTEYLGGTFSTSGAYPPWEYQQNSGLRDLFLKESENIFDTKPNVTTLHAGLECGILAKKLPGIDMISIGPDIPDIHTPAERLSIASTARIWQWLCQVLPQIK